ncbi:MAG: tetratricopeptide repeat protein [Fimbriimonadales bacterium]
MECGARISEAKGDTLAMEGSDIEVYPEIARANLLRMQGKYEEAVSVCRQILGRFPSNETAHALMGDIYADQGKLEDAIQWYEMLVELAPDSAVYSAKLFNLRALHAAQVAPPPPVEIPEEKPAKAPTPRVWAYLVGGVLTLILVVSAFVAGARLGASAENTPSSQVASSSLSNLGTVSQPQDTPNRVIPPPQVSEEPPSQPPQLRGTFTGMSQPEEQIARAVSQRLNGLPIWCSYDPVHQVWQVRSSVRAGVLSRERLMQDALAIAAAFLTQVADASSVTVSLLLPSATGEERVAFSVDVPRQIIPANYAQLGGDELNALFQQLRVWQNPALNLP